MKPQKHHKALPLVLGAAMALSPGCVTTSRRIAVHSTPPSSEVLINQQSAGRTPLERDLRWEGKGTVHQITVRAPDYEAQTRPLDFDWAMHQNKNTPASLNFELQRLAAEFTLRVESTPGDAAVWLDGKNIGNTPLAIPLRFERASSTQSFPAKQLRVSKDTYRYRASGTALAPDQEQDFVRELTVADEKLGTLAVGLEPIRYRATWLRTLEPSGEGMKLAEELVYSQIGDSEREPRVASVTRITDLEPEGGFVMSRVSVHPRTGNVVYSAPHVRTDRQERYLNIWEQVGRGRMRVTDADRMDIEATVSSPHNDSAKEEYIYFSANRLSLTKWNLWRVEAGKPGLTKITDSPSSRIDTEPAVSPDGKKIGYTSYLREIAAPQVWVGNSDGSTHTQLRSGKSPSWSPDGRKIVFVSPNDRGFDQIWVMEANGENPTQLTSGSNHNRHPCWTPDGQGIVFSSNQATDDEGHRNFDIWMMNSDGGGATQLTVNGSYDTRPAVSPDGRHIYFISNRGATKTYDESWQVWRISLNNQ